MIGLTICLTVFMFFASSSDNVLVNELQLRIKYSLYAFTTLINIALIYFSCVNLRKDIDDRRFHTIAAAPVKRAQIWLGKFLGILSFGFIIFLTGALAIAMSSTIFIIGWEDKNEIASLNEKFYRTYYVCSPDLTLLEQEVEKEYKIRRAKLEKEQEEEHEEEEHHHDEDGHHDHEHEGEEWRARKILLTEVRKEKQVIAPDKTGKWNFDWKPSHVKGDFVLLRFKFYANNRRQKVNGQWSITGTDWKEPFSGYPFLDYEIRIPADKLDKTNRFELVYKPMDSAYVIFPVYSNGISILYDSGGILKNFILLLFFSILHMATLTCLALTASSLFSYPVAVFATTTTYITGAFSYFFVNVLKDLSYHDQTPANFVFSKMIELGLWFTEGTQAFPVREMFSDGISIPVLSIFQNDFTGYLIYIVVVSMVGIFALTRKEIDKILQS